MLIKSFLIFDISSSAGANFKLVSLAKEWKYSSAKNYYDDFDEVLTIDMNL